MDLEQTKEEIRRFYTEDKWHQPGCTCQTCFLTAAHIDDETTIMQQQGKLHFYRVCFWPLVACLCLLVYTVQHDSRLFDAEQAAHATEVKAAYEAGKHDVLMQLVEDFKRVDAKYAGSGGGAGCCAEEIKERDAAK